jgi:hypothetical protein
MVKHLGKKGNGGRRTLLRVIHWIVSRDWVDQSADVNFIPPPPLSTDNSFGASKSPQFINFRNFPHVGLISWLEVDQSTRLLPLSTELRLRLTLRMALARQMSCLCPSEKLVPPSDISVSKPAGKIEFEARNRRAYICLLQEPVHSYPSFP